ncbi:DUF6361 family protein [Geothermobacter hydrogeniphilus]|uniref:Uncharacterized protein n=1 Tax=Geothermobacter hydrogeniphilus TaxID=1969733 RepID=A0A1X0XSR8_9BACT|nr:DUF6361 family protein [Geothermobacter hydrogeniphilus]ORJ55897.1 hypothetical protein B5V00_14655 [Geothermobacter hydrogeniphilus]
MVSNLTWIDHDSKARERTLRILSLFQEKESRDELGLGSVRDSFADQLFPGTSTIQTRLRYMLFVPWIYQALEEKRVPVESFAIQADKLERDLVQPLMDSDDQAGVFGKTAGKKLKRLPSSVYWAGLGVWGIRLTPFSQDEYHRRINEIYRRRDALKALEKDAKARGDDIDVEQRMAGLSWHPRLPAPPDSFPAKADFALSREEAEFIRDRIQVSCPNSLLSFLTLHCEPADTNAPWEPPDYGSFSDEHKELLTHARLFSETMHGAVLSYNIQLAQLRNHEDLVAKHRKSFSEWTASIPLDEIRSWSIKRLWELTVGHGHTITPQTRSFVQQWIEHIRKSPKALLSNAEALNLVKRREMKLKGTRSRFRNQRALEQWGGYSGVGKLVYRWPNVKVLLNDLYQGMNREEKC